MINWRMIGRAGWLAVVALTGLLVVGCGPEENDPTEVKAISEQKTNNPEMPATTNPEAADSPKALKGKGPAGGGP